MTKYKIKIITVLTMSFILVTINAEPRRVPEDYDNIQLAIDAASPRETVSVWVHTVPPDTYYENIVIDDSILVINRSFLPGQTPGYNSNWSHVVLNGQQQGSVIDFSEGLSRTTILKGFTITNGNGTLYNNERYYGGGILCVNSSPTITRNRITRNKVSSSTYLGRGGGVAIIGENAQPKISLNSIDSNFAYYKGGGIAFDYFAAPDIDSNFIYRNGYLDSNLTWRGGAISADNENSVDQELGRIYFNKIQENVSTHSCAADFSDASPLVQLNEIIENGISQSSDNVINCIVSFGSNVLPNFGSRNDPGLNIFENNGGEYDINNGSLDTITAQGNYWNSLHTSDIKNRMGERIDFDPVAASDRVFSVDSTSRCSTNVIITGDLTVTSGDTLTILPGKTFKFETTPDCSTGFSANLCELIINGNLQAIGTQNNKVIFTSYATSAAVGDWYGVRLGENSNATFDNCTLKFAYCGIDAESSSVLSVDSSIIISNQVKGINIDRSQTAAITRSQINYNGVLWCLL